MLLTGRVALGPRILCIIVLRGFLLAIRLVAVPRIRWIVSERYTSFSTVKGDLHGDASWTGLTRRPSKVCISLGEFMGVRASLRESP
jgi:hypothetical protein